MAKICVFLAEGFEECEALLVVDLCRRAGLDLKMVSISENNQVTSSHGVTVVADLLLSQVNFDEVDMIVLPGGMPGTKNLEVCQPLMEQVESFYHGGKYVSAICAAPSILGHRGFLKGREAVSYPTFESHLEGATVLKETVAVSGHVTTSRGLGTAIDFGLAIIERFLGKEEAEKIAAAIVYR